MKMKGLRIQYVVALVFVIVMCASSVTLAEDSECCINCRNIYCEIGVPPSPICFYICSEKCPHHATCTCNSPTNLIGMYDPHSN